MKFFSLSFITALHSPENVIAFDFSDTETSRRFVFTYEQNYIQRKSRRKRERNVRSLSRGERRSIDSG